MYEDVDGSIAEWMWVHGFTNRFARIGVLGWLLSLVIMAGCAVPDPGDGQAEFEPEVVSSDSSSPVAPLDTVAATLPRDEPSTHTVIRAHAPEIMVPIDVGGIVIFVPSASADSCGNGVLDTGETCELGPDSPCCVDCGFAPAGSMTCRPSTSGSDPAETCNGVSSACPTDVNMTGEIVALIEEQHLELADPGWTSACTPLPGVALEDCDAGAPTPTGIYVPRAHSFLVRSPTSAVDGGAYNKPLVLVPGFDFGGGAEGALSDADYLTAVRGFLPFLDVAQAQGYDLWLVRFLNSFDSINSNGRVLAYALRDVSDFSGSDEHLRVIGFSLGGVLTRYALSWAEDTCIDHDGDNVPLWNDLHDPTAGCTGTADNFDHGARLFVSVAGAHDGANVNPWLQALTKESVEANAGSMDLTQSIASQQLLRDVARDYNVCGADPGAGVTSGIPASSNDSCELPGAGFLGSSWANVASVALTLAGWYLSAVVPAAGILVNGQLVTAGSLASGASGLIALGNNLVTRVEGLCGQRCCEVGTKMVTNSSYEHDDFYYLHPPAVGGIWDLNQPHDSNTSGVCLNELGGLPRLTYNVAIAHGSIANAVAPASNQVMEIDTSLTVANWITSDALVCDQHYAAFAADHEPGDLLPLSVVNLIEGDQGPFDAASASSDPLFTAVSLAGLMAGEDLAHVFLAQVGGGFFTQLSPNAGLANVGISAVAALGSYLASTAALSTELEISFQFHPSFIPTSGALMLVQPSDGDNSWTRFDRAWAPGASWWTGTAGAPSPAVNMHHTPDLADPTEADIVNRWEVPLLLKALQYPSDLEAAYPGKLAASDFVYIGGAVDFGGTDKDMDGVADVASGGQDYCDFDIVNSSFQSNVCDGNRPPCADAGAAIQTDIGFSCQSEVQVGSIKWRWQQRYGTNAPLDAAGSSDPNGTGISYAWTIINRPRFGYCYPFSGAPGASILNGGCGEINVELPVSVPWGDDDAGGYDLTGNATSDSPNSSAQLSGGATVATPHIRMKPYFPWRAFFNKAAFSANGAPQPLDIKPWRFNPVYHWNAKLDEEAAQYIMVDLRLQVVDPAGVASVYDYTKVIRHVAMGADDAESVCLRTFANKEAFTGTRSLADVAARYNAFSATGFRYAAPNTMGVTQNCTAADIAFAIFNGIDPNTYTYTEESAGFQNQEGYDFWYFDCATRTLQVLGADNTRWVTSSGPYFVAPTGQVPFDSRSCDSPDYVDPAALPYEGRGGLINRWAGNLEAGYVKPGVYSLDSCPGSALAGVWNERSHVWEFTPTVSRSYTITATADTPMNLIVQVVDGCVGGNYQQYSDYHLAWMGWYFTGTAKPDPSNFGFQYDSCLALENGIDTPSTVPETLTISLTAGTRYSILVNGIVLNDDARSPYRLRVE